MRLCFNAGHLRGTDPGAVGAHGLREADVTTRIVHALLDRRWPYGWEVYAKRQTGGRKTLGELMGRVAASKPDIFVAVHCNSVGKGILAEGAQVYYPIYPWAYCKGKRLAELMLPMLPNHRARWSKIASAAFRVLRPPLTRPFCCALVEADFLSNPVVEALMQTATWVSTVAEGIRQGIEAYAKELGP